MARHRVVLAMTAIVWVLGVGAGARALWKHQVTSGAPGDALDRWPTTSRLDREADRFTLILAAHPHCPCTRASVDGLARLMAGLENRVTAYVLLMKPIDHADGWEKTDTWSSASRIPGVTVVTDVDGIESKRFGARTSGLAMLYDPSGHLLFRGGLTASRGHAGPSVGQQSIVDLVNGGSAEASRTAVFGCALAD